MSVDVMRKKRGRKNRDDTDQRIREARTQVPRGLKHVIGLKSLADTLREHRYTADEMVRAALDRELDITRDHELVEMREVPIDDEGNSLGGSPVSVRLALPALSVAKCLTQAEAQIRLFQDTDEQSAPLSSFFTPEAHILLSKACEQLVIELSTRAFLQSAMSGSPNLVTAQSLRDGVTSAWSSKGTEYSAIQSLHFLTDVIDRFEDESLWDDLDSVAKIHRTR